MLSDAAYEAWFSESGLPDNARPIIDQVRSTPPFRNARPSARRSTVTFPSRKMGCTIQGESGTVHYAFIRECEYNDDICEYYDQPPASVWLEYEKNGRRVRPVEHIADYFVIGKTWTGWVRCATEDELLKLEKDNPNLYCRDAEGRWQCPPGERYAAKFGLSFRVYSLAEVDWVWQHNMEFLDDYRRGEPMQVPEEVVQAVRELVEAHPGITIDELLACAREVLSDDNG